MLNCLAFLFCNTSHIKHMKRGHSETEAGHHFFHIFQGGKLNPGFSAYAALSLSDVILILPHYHIQEDPLHFSCHRVPVCQLLAEKIYISGNPWISWIIFWADPLNGWWTLMGSLLSYSSLRSQLLPLLSHEHTPWISKIIEGILRMGNADLRPDAMIAPVRAGSAKGHSCLQPGPTSMHF